VQFKVASVEVTGPYLGLFGDDYYIHLKDGGKFTAMLMDDGVDLHQAKKKLGIERVTDLNGRVVRVTGRVEPSGMWVRDLANIEIVNPKTDGKE
jgi:hypothetical protein